MPISKDLTVAIANNILKEHSIEEIRNLLRPRYPSEKPLGENFPKHTELTKKAQEKRLEILKKNGLSLPFIEGTSNVKDPSVYRGNIENFIGIALVPIGIIGPLRVNGLNAHGDFYVPLATTEGALVASYHRGAKIIALSGGAATMCLHERISRAPGFCFNNLLEASEFIVWCTNQFEKMQEVASQTTSHGKLENINVSLVGNQVFLNLEYFTGDASGQNMVTIASEAVCQYILGNSPIKPRYHFIESNLSGDKKATSLSFLSVRGKKVTAEVIIPRKLIQKFLRTTPEKMLEYSRMSFLGGIQSGSIGIQGHYANGLAAIFLACGQDIACVSEASIGITHMELTASNDLYFSVNLPNLIVGTVGGGTSLPTQSECLSLLGCKGNGTAKKFSEICAATVLAGEISIVGALAGGYFAQAHKLYGRK